MRKSKSISTWYAHKCSEYGQMNMDMDEHGYTCISNQSIKTLNNWSEPGDIKSRLLFNSAVHENCDEKL